MNSSIITDAAEDSLERLGLDSGINGGGGQRGVKSKKVSCETRDVWGSHRSPGEGVGSAVIPGRDNL